MMVVVFLALRDAYTCLQQQVAEGVIVFCTKSGDRFVEDEVHEGSPVAIKKQEKRTPCRGSFPCG